MPFSVPPTILLAAASFAFIAGPFMQLRVKRICEVYCLIVILVTAVALAVEPIQNLDPTAGLTVRPVFRNDSLACCEQWLVLSFGLLSAIAMFDAPRREQDAANSTGYLLFAIAGLCLTATANDLISLGLSLEILRLAIGAQRTLSPPDTGTERSVSHRFDAGQLASGAMWMGIALVSMTTAATQFDSIRTVLAAAYDPGIDQTVIGAPSKLVLLGVGLIAMSLFAHMGLMPFSLDSTSRTDRLSCPAQGFRILALQFAGSIGLTRLFGSVLVGLGQPLIVLTMTVALATFVLAAILISRGFSAGSRTIVRFVQGLLLLQSGWLTIAVMILSTELQRMAIPWSEFSPRTETLSLTAFLQLIGLLASGSMFWILASLAQSNREVAFLEDVKGLGSYARPAAWTLVVAMATTASIPLTAGFWARWMILLSGNNVHSKSTSRIFQPHSGLRIVMLVGIIATFFAVIAVIRVAREMFLESPLARCHLHARRGAFYAAVFAALICTLLAAAPQAALGPLRSIRSPRDQRPDSPLRGSGKNLLGDRTN